MPTLLASLLVVIVGAAAWVLLVADRALAGNVCWGVRVGPPDCSSAASRCVSSSRLRFGGWSFPVSSHSPPGRAIGVGPSGPARCPKEDLPDDRRHVHGRRHGWTERQRRAIDSRRPCRGSVGGGACSAGLGALQMASPSSLCALEFGCSRFSSGSALPIF